MNILFKNAGLLEGYGYGAATVNVLVENGKISYIGKNIPDAHTDREIECNGNLLMPAFYNAHSHVAMSLFRGYGDDLPLDEWLNNKIFPAEDRLDGERVYYGSMISIMEMIRSGVVSFSDMYYFMDDIARAVSESGVKANLCRSVVTFDENEDFSKNTRIVEALELYKNWHNKCDGRIKVDMSLHAEYTNVKPCFEYFCDTVKNLDTIFHIHVSETQKEHEDCIKRHGLTPIAFLEKCGALNIPTIAAHCVWVTEDDMRIMKAHNVTAVHNPVSNLKLGSGIMPYNQMREYGINIALGTDGAASNNSQSIMKEMQYASLIHKVIKLDAASTLASDMIKCATRNGALAQRRDDCGIIGEGMKADLILIDMNAINNIPSYSFDSTLCYSANESNVIMTMCDGNILYENGTYTSIDEELLKYKAKEIISHYFD